MRPKFSLDIVALGPVLLEVRSFSGVIASIFSLEVRGFGIGALVVSVGAEGFGAIDVTFFTGSDALDG